MKEKNSFILYNDQRETFNAISDEQAGKLIKIIYQYSSEKTISCDDEIVKLLFIPIKQQMDRDLESYIEKCEKNKANIFKRWNTTEYERIPNDTKHTDTDNDTDNDTDIKKENIKRKSYGTYKRIKLTDKQIEKLHKDFGKEFITKQIQLLDEYIQSNNNKNKYSDFNLVLRRSIKEDWFKGKAKFEEQIKKLVQPKKEELVYDRETIELAKKIRGES